MSSTDGDLLGGGGHALPAPATFWYLVDFVDEVMPCEPTLDAWAQWLSKGDGAFGHDEPARDGQTFQASAVDFTWHRIRLDEQGKWRLPADLAPGYSMIAVCHNGQGWFAEDIVADEAQLAELLTDWGQEETELTIAVGRDCPDRYVATYHAAGPTLTIQNVGRPN